MCAQHREEPAVTNDRVRKVTHIDNIKLSEDGTSIIIIDQTKLPNRVEYIELKTAQDVWDAIHLLKVRGAPAIGIAAGYAMPGRFRPMITKGSLLNFNIRQNISIHRARQL